MIEFLKRLIFFFSNSVFAFCVALYGHEVGHGIFIYLFKGYFPQIKMNPLVGGYASSFAVPLSNMQQICISGGGILWGIVVGLIITLLCFRCFKNAWAAPFVLTGVVSVSVNALMMTGGYFLFQKGDVPKLVALGVPLAIIVIAGLIFLFVSLVLFIRSMVYMGIDRQTTLVKKIGIIFGSVLIYSMIVIIYIYLNKTGDAPRYFRYIMMINVTLLAGLLAVHYCAPVLSKPNLPAYRVTWVNVGCSLMLALSVFCYMLQS